VKQLVLDIRSDAPPSFDNFVAGTNQPALDALADPATGHVYLWGEAGSGKSHLLQAVCAAARDAGRTAHFRRAADIDADLPDDADALLAVDDIPALGEAAQITLFNAFNRSARRGQRLVLSGTCAPLGLTLREDLRTRVGQCLVFHLQPLDDLARSAILTSQAQRRGLRLENEVVGYLLRYGRRDLPSLLATLDALDQASLEHKRPITLPLLRELLQQGLPLG
jgi:DnaA family protein